MSVEDEVLRLAADAADAGLHGVVCSGDEARAVAAAYGDRLALLVPGIRLEGGDAHDQQRVVTPRAAQRAGARYVVLGRHGDGGEADRAAMRRVLTDLAAAGWTGGPAMAETRCIFGACVNLPPRLFLVTWPENLTFCIDGIPSESPQQREADL